ncbi:MAG: T9SS type A sorting domain-containing protein [Bacteroidales bacterium]|nr:T9SS type A sorting domain-containing protein [Bacteroidales bacterium]
MNKLFTFLFAVLVSANIIAQTNVSGNQSGTWTAANSPYNVTGEITVLAGEVLTIEPGVEVNFQGYYKFNIFGNLQAIGTETDSIFFTTDNQATGWGGIRVDVADINDVINLTYCRIEYGKSAATDYPDIHGGGLALFSSDAVISHCVFADNDATGNDNGMGGAIYAINTGNLSGVSATSISDTKFIRNHCYGEGGAIKFTSDGNTEITNCEFIGNDCLYGGGAISFYSVVGTKMIRCLFADNYTMYSNGGAVHMLGFSNTLFFKNCTITGNQAVTGDGGGVYIVNGVIDFVNCIAYNNSAMYGGTQGDNIYVTPDGSTATINYCNLIMPEYGSSGANNINVNPLFVDANNGNFHLQEISECIDAGTDIGFSYEGDAPDMGCFEYGVPNNVNKNDIYDFIVYPNPAKDYFTIQNIKNAEYLLLFDISGKVILSRGLFKMNKVRINTSDFKRGIYFINIFLENNKIESNKIVLSK